MHPVKKGRWFLLFFTSLTNMIFKIQVLFLNVWNFCRHFSALSFLLPESNPAFHISDSIVAHSCAFMVFLSSNFDEYSVRSCSNNAVASSSVAVGLPFAFPYYLMLRAITPNTGSCFFHFFSVFNSILFYFGNILLGLCPDLDF